MATSRKGWGTKNRQSQRRRSQGRGGAWKGWSPRKGRSPDRWDPMKGVARRKERAEPTEWGVPRGKGRGLSGQGKKKEGVSMTHLGRGIEAGGGGGATDGAGGGGPGGGQRPQTARPAETPGGGLGGRQGTRVPGTPPPPAPLRRSPDIKPHPFAHIRMGRGGALPLRRGGRWGGSSGGAAAREGLGERNEVG